MMPIEESARLRIELCREQDINSVMTFIHEEWAKNHILSRDEALFRWQYDSTNGSGATDNPSVLIAWRGDRIVGMLGLTPMRWLQNGTTHSGAWSSHWYVVPELRASPVAFLLIRHAQQLGFEVNGTVGTSAAAILRVRGYEIIPEIPRRVAIIDPAKTAALLLAGGVDASREREIIEFCDRSVSAAKPREANHEWAVGEWSTDVGESWDACWKEAIAPRFAGAVRDSAFIRWRYLNHPTFQYHVSVARHCPSGTVHGVLVSRLETVRGRTEKVLRICDLLTDRTAPADCLLQHLIQTARQNGVAFADFYCTKSIDSLSQYGFFAEHATTDELTLPSRLQPLESGGRPLNAAIRLPEALRGTIGDLLARGELYLTKADGDQDRPN
ncbi:MAG TPA: hypothetical protein VJN70_06600 [Gemmatimonadaceae bacterium]|nr:hypothetical protein [Gemmatimonadaceae bacterium]